MSSVQEHRRKTMTAYATLLASDVPAFKDEYQDELRQVTAALLKLWAHAQNESLWSRNDSFSELSTTALSLLPMPFYIGNLCNRRMGDPADPNRNKNRLMALAASNDFLMKFLQLALQFDLIDERSLEKRVNYNPNDRQSRIQWSQAHNKLEKEIATLDQRLAFLKARTKRLREMEGEGSGEDNNDDDDNETQKDAGEQTTAEENEDEWRQRYELEAKWAVHEASQMLQMNKREMEMLGSMTEEEQKKAAEAYQEALIKPPVAHGTNASAQSQMYLNARTADGSRQQEENAQPKNFTILPGGRTVPIDSVRQQAKEDAFKNRNVPVMSLEEFAEMEMAMMKRDMEIGAEIQKMHDEEDERLGVEGREERQRKKDADWDDWKDDNPSQGKTGKGNYA